MKAVVSTKLLFTAFAVLLFSLNGFLKADTVSPDYNISKASIANLKMGIKLNNEGVRKCCIYFAGKYKISDLTDDLVEQFKNEKNPKIRVLIALSLYQIEDGESMEFLKNISQIDNDPHVRKMCMAIYDEYSKNKATAPFELTNTAK
jgi:hypothetical protein